mgnify:CR=1 FL=1|tara:strand:- start:24 stop:851 length:828 start_codon:yes stop_codon:yes gene_type:complete
MSSIVIKSSAFASSGLALNSQTFTEDISGLVRVSMRFTTTKAKRDSVSQLFYVDAPPPIWPSSIDSYLLQTEQLYMVDRNVTQSNGLVEISAQYAGALKSSVANPRVSIERIGGAFSFQVYVSRQVLSAMWLAGGPNGFYLGNTNTQDVFDSYQGTFVGANKRVSYAQVGDDILSIDNPDAADLILGVVVTQKTLADISDQFTPFPTDVSGAVAGANALNYGFYVGGPFYDRSRTPLSLLRQYGNLFVASDAATEFITPSVTVRNLRFSPYVVIV